MSVPSLPLWQGRVLALLGIVLAAFSLRTGVAALSPLVGHIQAEIELPSAVIGLIGAAPPMSFAVLGLLTPFIERRLGLPATTAVAMTAIAVGTLWRAGAPEWPGVLAGTLLLFAGGGMGNVLLPPLVKRYFPDRLGVMMTAYTLMLASSTFIPPIFSVPVADATGWRFSVGMWGFLTVAALIPWVILLLRERGTTGALSTPSSHAVGRVIRSPLGWSIALIYAISALTGYVAFAWYPTLITERAGVDPATAGLLLAVFGASSIPWALLVPVLVVRWQATRPLYLIAAIGAILGVGGLLLVPQPEFLLLWTILYGFVGGLFPLGLVLISVRSRTPEGVVVLSGLVQGVGFGIAAIFPVLWGVLREATGDWTIPLLLLIVALIGGVPISWVAGRRTTVEDEWEVRHARSW